jgi:hypothetical protein
MRQGKTEEHDGIAQSTYLQGRPQFVFNGLVGDCMVSSCHHGGRVEEERVQCDCPCELKKEG